MADVYVYKSDGTRQCEGGGGTSLEEATTHLASIIGRDEILESFEISMVVVQLCGAPTGYHHVCRISEAGWALLSTGIVGPLGWQLWLLKTNPHAFETGKQHALAGRLDGGPETPFPLHVGPEDWGELPSVPGERSGSALDPAIIETIRKLTSVQEAPTTFKELLGYELRVIRPGDSVTLDLRSRRVNISVDGSDRIVGVSFH